MSKHNTVKADFGYARRWKLDPETAFLAGLVLVLGLLLANGALTQWFAAQFSYSAALGEPLWVSGETSYYLPWRWVEWAAQLDEASPIRAKATSNGSLAVLGPFLLALIVVGRRRTAAMNRADQLHGSARWADRDDVEQAGLLEGQGVFLATWQDKKTGTLRYLRHDGPEHAIALAPTRSGKGVGIVLPTLLTWPHSALILDPKAENWALTAGRRAQMGQKVICFNPASMKSARFNPLAEVRTGTDHEIADVQLLAVSLVNPSGKEQSGASEHFNVTAAALLTAAMLHCLYRHRNERLPVPTLADLALELGHPDRTPEVTLQGWMSYSHLPGGTHPLVASEARAQLSRMATPEGSGVWSTARRPLALFLDPIVGATTSASDFKLEDLVSSAVPTSIYLSVPAGEFDRLQPLLRLFISLTLRRLTRELEFEGGVAKTAGKQRVLMLLDEFPTLGKIEQLQSALAYMAGYGVKVLLVAQTYNQVVEAYGRNEGILANCHIKVAYAAGDMETAKLISGMAGETTVEMKSRSYSLGGPGGRKVSESYHQHKRPLVTVDEATKIPGPRKDGPDIVEAGEVVAFSAGRPAIRATQMLYFEDPKLLAWTKIPAPPIAPLVTGGPKPVPPAAPSAPTAESTTTPSAVTAAFANAEKLPFMDTMLADLADPNLDLEDDAWPDSAHDSDPSEDATSAASAEDLDVLSGTTSDTHALEDDVPADLDPDAIDTPLALLDESIASHSPAKD